MTYFEWHDRYDVGIDELNAEHKKLIETMNALFETNQPGADRNVLTQLLEALHRLAAEHFGHEEAHMERLGHDDLERHRAVHAELLDKLSRYQSLFSEGGGLLPDGFFTFLKLWLSAHMQGVDKRYADTSAGEAQ